MDSAFFFFLETFQKFQSFFPLKILEPQCFEVFYFVSFYFFLTGFVQKSVFISFLLLIQSMSSVSHLTFMNVFFVKMGPFKTLQKCFTIY